MEIWNLERFHMSNEKELEEYCATVRKFPIPSESETLELCEQMQNGNLKAREELINRSLRLVLKEVLKYQHKHEDIMDLIQVGNIGLIKAVDSYDLEKGIKLSTYIVNGIRLEIKKYFSSNAGGLIRIPHWSASLDYKIRNAENELFITTGREPTDKELSTFLNIKEASIKTAKSQRLTVLSTDTIVYEDNGSSTTLMDMLINTAEEDEREKLEEQAKLIIDMIKNNFSEDDYEMFISYYGIGKLSETYEELGRRFGMSRTTVMSRIYMILDKLQCYFGCERTHLKALSKR